ncbi:hypothetical protein [Mesorhizobium sp. 1M-11]|uniref:hypothetical protein n=1 Tax=Mesorhizobium sp. 1M-11 TaxID=1529006 RepID=UPI00128EFAE2|nr:hypothetical protein [Mesorhizobium sp. 1M-11]
MSRLQFIDILVRDKSATTSGRSVDDDYRVGRHASFHNNGMIARLGCAGEKPGNQTGIGFVDLGFDKFDSLTKSGVITPNINCAHLGTAKYHLLFSGNSIGHPSDQYDRNGYRSTHKPLPPMTSHLGTFEGERKRNTRGFDEDCSTARALCSLLAITVFLYAVSLFTRVY